MYTEAEDVVQYFLGSKVGPKYGHGYNLGEDNSTLIIDSVADEDSGTWWCNVVTTDPWSDRGATNVTVIGRFVRSNIKSTSSIIQEGPYATN